MCNIFDIIEYYGRREKGTVTRDRGIRREETQRRDGKKEKGIERENESEKDNRHPTGYHRARPWLNSTWLFIDRD